MKVKELKERLGFPPTGEQNLTTGRLIAYIKDGLEEINMLAETHVTTERFDITKDQRFYNFPKDALKILEVRCKNYRNNKGEYRKIPRLINEPLITDKDGA
tara:strand:+ start:1134 stop:1436 length:303 start_codon:yes stop_codon:yes gene_type:complete